VGYVAVKGGAKAIDNACRLLAYQRVKGKERPLGVKQIQEQLYLLVDRVMGEGSLYAPELAALAVKQAAGDTLEAAFMIRAYRTTLPRIGFTLPHTTGRMRVFRRISAAFKDIPGGQVLGPTSDYTLRLLDFELLDETAASAESFRRAVERELPDQTRLPDTFPKVVEILRAEGLIVDARHPEHSEGNEKPFDITRESLVFPVSRSARLQGMARGETGGLLLLAYSSMRGYGDVHPIVGELRVGYLPVVVADPYTGDVRIAGEVKATEAEIIARYDNESGKPQFTIGYGLCFGQNEIKAISMAILDRAMQAKQNRSPANDQEFVLSHIDGIESMGFCNHWKLPHYVDFQSDLDRIRKAQVYHDNRGMDERKNAPGSL
jgi:alpha-D-ribose 1-methylphosphonate 5-triphosphate synthase subunit PhnI